MSARSAWAVFPTVAAHLLEPTTVPEPATLVVIPTYNERDNLPELVEQIGAQGAPPDLLIVDDNSPDGTGALADQLAEAGERMHVLHRRSKAGLGRAYIAGYRWSLDTARTSSSARVTATACAWSTGRCDGSSSASAQVTMSG
jgi:hypothetical protein